MGVLYNKYISYLQCGFFTKVSLVKRTRHVEYEANDVFRYI